MTLVKSVEGHVFGGFSDIPWDSSGERKSSQAAFLFKLGQHNQVSVSHHAILQNHGHAILCRGENGPTFGAGTSSNDLFVQLNGAGMAHMNLAHTYNPGPGNVQSLAESPNCLLSEVEVFVCRSKESLSLSEGERAVLLQELQGLHIDKLHPIYRGSRDGYTAQAFHQRCDKIGRTVTVLKSAQGHVFGGFSDIAWDSCGQYQYSQTAFLFKLGQPDQLRFSKHNLFQNHDYAVLCKGSCGPTFGGKNDLHVALNGTGTAQMTLGHTYTQGPDNLVFLAESQTCALAEVEVFSVGNESSLILSARQTAALRAQLQGTCELRLLYRGSRDGFNVQSFHQRCDHVARTVTVLKSTEGHVFGGYSDVAWDFSNQMKHSAAAFLFKLGQDDQVNVARYDVAQDHQNAIYCHKNNGPTFGTGPNLRVHLNSPQNSRAEMELHGSCRLPQFLAESQNPVIKEVEVFAVLSDSSTVFSEVQKAALLQQMEHAGRAKLRLLYRGTRDGFTAHAFHERCDNVGPTITVVKSAQGHVLGGFSDIAWSSDADEYKNSEGAFLFKLGQHEQVSFSRHDLFQNHANAIYCRRANGPAFGGNSDFQVQLDGTGTACMNLGHTYSRGEGDVHYLSEAENSMLADVEVYCVE